MYLLLPLHLHHPSVFLSLAASPLFLVLLLVLIDSLFSLHPPFIDQLCYLLSSPSFSINFSPSFLFIPLPLFIRLLRPFAPSALLTHSFLSSSASSSSSSSSSSLPVVFPPPPSLPLPFSPLIRSFVILCRSPCSAPGSGPMFRSTTVAVEPGNQSGPDLVQNWADIHAGGTAAAGTSERRLPSLLHSL